MSVVERDRWEESKSMGADVGDGVCEFGERDEELVLGSARTNEHAKIKNGVFKLGSEELWEVFGNVVGEAMFAVFGKAEYLCFVWVEVKVAGVGNDVEDGVGVARGVCEVGGGKCKIVAECADDASMGGEVGGHKANYGVDGEGEKGHGEWASLFNAGGEEEGEA